MRSEVYFNYEDMKNIVGTKESTRKYRPLSGLTLSALLLTLGACGGGGGGSTPDPGGGGGTNKLPVFADVTLGSVDIYTNHDGLDVGTFVASDADSGDTITYSLGTGTDSAKFSIDATTGVLSFVTAKPVYDTTTSANNTLSVTIVAADGNGGTAEHSVTIQISDFNRVEAGEEATDGKDAIFGTSGDDILDGKGGDDTLEGGAGEDTLTGGAGNDILNGGAGVDTLTGGAGNDILNGGAGNDILNGGAGDDTYGFDIGEAGNNTITDSLGTDTISLTGTGVVDSNVKLILNGDDLDITYDGVDGWSIKITGWTTEANRIENFRIGDVYYDLGAGDYSTEKTLDTLDKTIPLGTDGNDVLIGNEDNNMIDGLAGDDTIDGKGGNDTLIGRTGNDTLNGGAGDDQLFGGANDDAYVFDLADSGNNTISDLSGTDTILLRGKGVLASEVSLKLEIGVLEITRAGSDGWSIKVTGWDAPANRVDNLQIGDVAYNLGAGTYSTTAIFANTLNEVIPIGTSGDDTITGDAEDNIIDGLAGNDTLSGLGGKDTLTGGEGEDTLSGGEGDDTLSGGAGIDTIDGGEGKDTIDGGAGDDIIEGGEGNDILEGGEGDDTYGFDLTKLGFNTITDVSGTDTILLKGSGIKVSEVKWTLDSGNFEITYKDIPGWSVSIIDRFKAEPANRIENLQIGDVTYGLRVGTNAGGGKTGDNDLNGTDGIDYIFGFGNNDTINSGKGDDVLDGGTGDDAYEFNIGDSGHNTITDEIGTDTILLTGTDILASKVQLKLNGDALEITYEGITNWSITVLGWTTESNRIENLRIGVATYNLGEGTYTTTAILADTLGGVIPKGTDDDDILTGDERDNVIDGLAGGDRISGLGGNDTLIGGAGNDILIGGEGNDILEGGVDSDSYNFDLTELGNNTITDEAGAEDTIRLTGTEVAASNVRWNLDGNDLGVTYEGITGWSIAIKDWTTPANRIEKLWIEGDKIYDLTGGTNTGETLTGEDDTGDYIFGLGGNDIIDGKKGNDILYGGKGNDIIDGGEGDDTLLGGEDDDTYEFDIGDLGDNTITETSGSDTLLLKRDVLETSKIGFTLNGDDLDVTYEGITGWSIKVTGGNTIANRIEKLQIGADTYGLIAGTAEDDNPLNGGSGNDYILGFGGRDTIDGAAGNDILYGGAGIDTLRGGTGRDTLHGGADGDRLEGGADSDELYGGDGIDTLIGGAGDDKLYGGDGGDALNGGIGNDILEGDDNNDTLNGDGGSDILIGGEGDDIYAFLITDISDKDNTITETSGSDTISLRGDGTTSVEISKLTLVIEGLAGARTLKFIYDTRDLVTINNWNNSTDHVEKLQIATVTYSLIRGTDNADAALNGTNFNDYIFGLNGNDTIDSGKGNDTLVGGAGDDIYEFDIGNDGRNTITDISGTDTVILKGTGVDVSKLTLNLPVNGDDLTITHEGSTGWSLLIKNWTTSGNKIEKLRIDDGTDAVTYSLLGGTVANDDGTSGNPILTGTFGPDYIFGLTGNDTINSGTGDDVLNGGTGEDTIDGGAGNDKIYGGADGDTISGQAGNDEIYGGAGDDIIDGFNLIAASPDDDNDKLYGEAGKDRLSGRGGNDELYGGAGIDTLYGGTGNDILQGGDDKDTYTFFSDESGHDTLTDTGGFDTILLNTIGAFTASDVKLATTGAGNDLILTISYKTTWSITITDWTTVANRVERFQIGATFYNLNKDSFSANTSLTSLATLSFEDDEGLVGLSSSFDTPDF